MNARGNNFDLLRLLFAGAVVLWHEATVTRAPALDALAFFFSAEVGVKGFFVVSGYLVVMSCERSASLADYARKRVRRIYPAYFAVVVLCALAGMIASPVSLEHFKYLLANLAFLNFLAPTLPGVFAHNPWTEVNGALWTLKIEVMFYAIVPLIVFASRRLGSFPVLALLYVLSVSYTVVTGKIAAEGGGQLWYQLQRQLPGQLTYFLSGAAFYLYRDRVEGRWGWIVAAGALAFVLDRLFGLALFLEPLWLGAAVIFAACGLPYLGNFARFGDLSYGIYIIHFPLIQAALAAGLYARDPWLACALTIAGTVALAFASWHLVEKPFLDRRSHYRLAEGART